MIAKRQQNMSLEALADMAKDANAFVKSIVSEKPKNQENEEDGAPPSPPPPLPKGLPPGHSDHGPRLQDKLATMVPKDLPESTLKLMDKAKTDTNAQDDLKTIMMDITGTAFTLWIPPKLARVQVGHTPFIFMSKVGEEDPYHRHTIFYMGDRDERGDPTPFAMAPEQAKKCGTWQKVKWDNAFAGQAMFFGKEENLHKLYSPEEGVDLNEEEAPLTILVGPKTAEYVLQANPSPAQLEDWADKNLEGKEGAMVEKFAAMAAQTKPNNKEKRPSSILAHDLEPVLKIFRIILERLLRAGVRARPTMMN